MFLHTSEAPTKSNFGPATIVDSKLEDLGSGNDVVVGGMKDEG